MQGGMLVEHGEGGSLVVRGVFVKYSGVDGVSTTESVLSLTLEAFN
jgi:hypothetical protein